VRADTAGLVEGNRDGAETQGHRPGILAPPSLTGVPGPWHARKGRPGT